MSEQQSTSPQPDPSQAPDPVATTPATWWVTGVSFTAAVAAVAAAVLLLGGDDASGRTPAGAGAPAHRPDAEEVGELVEHTRTAHEGLVPVLEEMEEFLPTDGSHPPLDMTGAPVVDAWRTDVREAAGHLEESSADGTAHEIAHTGLLSSVRLLAMSVETYAKAAVVEDEDTRMDVLHIAMGLRDQAVVTWSVAATQLDVLSTATDHGHVHLYLPAAPDSGALRPDDAEEGGAGEGSGGGHDH